MRLEIDQILRECRQHLSGLKKACADAFPHSLGHERTLVAISQMTAQDCFESHGTDLPAEITKH